MGRLEIWKLVFSIICTTIPALSVWPDQQRHTFTNLKPGTEYSLLLLADNESRHIVSVRTHFGEFHQPLRSTVLHHELKPGVHVRAPADRSSEEVGGRSARSDQSRDLVLMSSI